MSPAKAVLLYLLLASSGFCDDDNVKWRKIDEAENREIQALCPGGVQQRVIGGSQAMREEFPAAAVLRNIGKDFLWN